MAKTAGVLRKSLIEAVCKGAFNSGAKQATVEVTLPDGTKMKMTAHADDPGAAKPSNGAADERLENLI
jgi:hypothetical protein